MPQQIYNVCLHGPTHSTSEWQEEAALWIALNAEVGGISDFNPLTIKARYVVGIILGACRSVSILLDEKNLISTTFYPAYVVFASAVELLGRCIDGNRTSYKTTDDLRTGFQWLCAPQATAYASVLAPNDIVVKTRNYEYPIAELVALRQFCAHGQGLYQSTRVKRQPVQVADLLALHNITAQGQSANQSPVRDFDYLILGELPPLIGKGIEAYLTELQSVEELANRLADAGVTPFRNRPIMDSMWGFPADADLYPTSIGNALRSMDWTYKDRGFQLGGHTT
jgi:hypothetical protein